MSFIPYLQAYPGQGEYGFPTITMSKPGSGGNGGGVAGFPFTRTFNDDTIDLFPANATKIGTAQVITRPWYDGNENWNPTGFTQAVRCNHFDSQAVGVYLDLPSDLIFDADWNFEVLSCNYGEGARGWTQNGILDINGDPWSTEVIYTAHNTYEQNIQTYARTNNVVEGNINQAGILSTAVDGYWCKHRLSLRVTGDSEYRILRASTGATITNGVASGDLAWETWLAGQSLNTLRITHQSSTSSVGYEYIARIYLGLEEDGWPSDS